MVMADPFKHVRSLQDITRIVKERLTCAGSFVMRVTDDEQLVLASSGLRVPAGMEQSMPLEYSISQHCMAMDFPLIIEDAISHPLMKGNLSVTQLGVAAYLGAPIHADDKTAVGVFGALEYRQRQWSRQDVESVKRAAIVAERFFPDAI